MTVPQEVKGARHDAMLDDDGHDAVENLVTVETNTTLVAAPDGAGGVAFRAESGGGGSIELIGPISIDDTSGTIDLSGIDPAASLATGTLLLDLWALQTTEPTSGVNGDELDLGLSRDSGGLSVELVEMDLFNGDPGSSVLVAFELQPALMAFSSSPILNYPRKARMTDDCHLYSELFGTGFAGGAWDVYALVIRP